MKKIFDLYGFKSDDLAKACHEVEKALNIHMELHESLHHGEYYLWRNIPLPEEITIERNLDEEQELKEDNYPEIKIIVYVSHFNNVDEIRQKLTRGIPEIIFLEREEIEKEK